MDRYVPVRRGFWILLVCILRSATLSGCGAEKITSPNARLSQLSLSPDTLELTDIEMTGSLVVTALDDRGEVVQLNTAPEILLIGEKRLLPSLPVVETVWQAPNVHLEATGPGSVGVLVKAGDLVSDTVSVTVTTTRAIVTALQAPEHALPGDPAVLTGYQMDSLMPEDVTVCGAPVPFLRASADSFWFAVPDLAGTSCDPASSVEVVVGASGKTSQSFHLFYLQTQAIDLAVGEYQILSSHTENAISIAPHPGARYALSYIDLRAVESSQTTAESDRLPWTTLSIHVGPVGASSQVALSPPLGSLSDRLVTCTGWMTDREILASDAPPADYYAYRTTPWQVGDSVSIRDPFVFTDFLGGKVIKIYNDYVCLVELDKYADQNISGRLSELDQTMARMKTYGYGTLESALSPTRPQAGSGTGQILIVPTGLPGGSGTVRDGLILVDPLFDFFPLSDPLHLDLNLVAHEVGHLWQQQYQEDLCASLGVCSGLGPAGWSLEGTAEFVSEEINRQALGHPLTGTIAGWTFYLGSWGPTYGTGAGGAWSFGRGYAGATWFMRDQLIGLIRSGVDYDTALSEVTKGSLDGWYGLGSFGAQRPGLVQRMSELRNRTWDPLVELPEALARLFLDDRPDDTYPALLEAWSEYTPFLSEVTPSSPRYDIFIYGWSFGDFIIDDEGAGGAYEFGSSVDGISWIIMRIL
jgi:hypothetical protein